MKPKQLSRLLAVVLSLALMLSILPVSSLAVGTDDAAVVYDAADISIFKDRTPQDVADRYSAAQYVSMTYSNGDSSTWYTTPASTQAPYAAGALTADTHETMTAMTNFYR